MVAESVVGLTGLVVWLLGVSFAAGLAVQRTRENSRRLDGMDHSGERLARIENDVKWIKDKLGNLCRQERARKEDEQ